MTAASHRAAPAAGAIASVHAPADDANEVPGRIVVSFCHRIAMVPKVLLETSNCAAVPRDVVCRLGRGEQPYDTARYAVEARHQQGRVVS